MILTFNIQTHEFCLDKIAEIWNIMVFRLLVQINKDQNIRIWEEWSFPFRQEKDEGKDKCSKYSVIKKNERLIWRCSLLELYAIYILNSYVRFNLVRKVYLSLFEV